MDRFELCARDDGRGGLDVSIHGSRKDAATCLVFLIDYVERFTGIDKQELVSTAMTLLNTSPPALVRQM